ncbi:hypothetical protein [Halomonas sp. PA5]|uniref:hypothetical protein n=2 Tax=Oceanospirillales TaxID=135619 RepID=UPI0020B881EA|nr:hypothetical protein [Halomonas sp. PA5]
MPEPCPNCGSHRMRVSQNKQHDDQVVCASCNTYICLYWEAEQKLLKDGTGSEAEDLLEQAFNRKKY